MKHLCDILVVVLAFGLLQDAVGNEPAQPNIIVIFTDDHGYADLSCQGSVADIKTPHIDALADGGVRMTSGYVTAPQCVPSRAGLLSGRYQNRFGVESNGMPLEGFNTQQTIAERMKTAGYATGMVGKWHLGRADQIVNHGFDDVFYQGGSWTNYDINGNDVRPGTKFDQLYHLDAKSAAARAFIKRHHEQPFFLYLAYRAPHVPLDATEKYLSRFPGEMPQRRRQALAMLSAVDDGVGGVMDSLREYGIEEKTLVFFIGDNGAPLKIHKLDAPGGGPGWDGSLNEPMNGEKGMLSEGGIRVPFVVYWKGKLPAGQIFDHPVISLDVAATATALAGLPCGEQLDGVNLVPYLRGQQQGPPQGDTRAPVSARNGGGYPKHRVPRRRSEAAQDVAVRCGGSGHGNNVAVHGLGLRADMFLLYKHYKIVPTWACPGGHGFDNYNESLPRTTAEQLSVHTADTSPRPNQTAGRFGLGNMPVEFATTARPIGFPLLAGSCQTQAPTGTRPVGSLGTNRERLRNKKLIPKKVVLRRIIPQSRISGRQEMLE